MTEILSQFGATWTTVLAVPIATAGAFLWVVLLTRLTGPRSLAKMSSFDFAATVAVGSTLASTALGSTPLVSGALVLLMLYGLQYAVARLRRGRSLAGVLDNEPLLLVAEGELLPGNLRHARISDGELWSQLRQAGVSRLEQVHAVVLETTGDLSVLTGGGPYDAELLSGVRGAEQLA